MTDERLESRRERHLREARVKPSDRTIRLRRSVCALVWCVALCAEGCGISPSPQDSALLHDTWLWNGTDWTQASSSPSPPPRVEAAVADDPTTGQVVLFGGRAYDNGPFFNDTWTFDGEAWTQQQPKHSPEPRSRSAIAFDPVLKELILVGGFVWNQDYVGDLTDVWAWNGTDWSRLGDAPPGMDFFLSFNQTNLFASDPKSGEMVEVSGAKTWSWNRQSWRQDTAPVDWTGLDLLYYDDKSGLLTAIAHTTTTGGNLVYEVVARARGKWRVVHDLRLSQYLPGWLAAAGIAYDSARRQVVILTVACADNPVSETLLFDGATWTTATPSHRPPSRYGTYLVYDGSRSAVVLVGGVSEPKAAC